MGLGAGQADGDVGVAVDAAGDDFPGGEEAADDEVAEAHCEGAVNEEGTAACLVDVEEHDGCEDDEEGVLYT